MSSGGGSAPASIRPAERRDAAAIVALWTAAYVDEGEGGRTVPYVEADFLDTVGQGHVLVAELDDAIVGVAALLGADAPRRAVARAGEAELSRLVVVAPVRRSGIGRTLAGRCEALAREQGSEAIVLWSRPYQTAAHSLYESLGYERAPERDTVDETGHERLVFRLQL